MSRVVVNEIEAKVGNDVTFNSNIANPTTVKGEGTATTNLQSGLNKSHNRFNFDGNSTDFIFEKGNVNTQYSIFSHGTDLVFRTVHQGVAGYDSLYGAKSQGITNGQYHHVLGSYNGSTKKLYIDGKEVATKNKTGNLVTTTPGASVGDFGGASTGYPFGGKIALIRVYNIGLTASQVKQNFEAIRGRFGI